MVRIHEYRQSFSGVCLIIEANYHGPDTFFGPYHLRTNQREVFTILDGLGTTGVDTDVEREPT